MKRLRIVAIAITGAALYIAVGSVWARDAHVVEQAADAVQSAHDAWQTTVKVDTSEFSPILTLTGVWTEEGFILGGPEKRWTLVTMIDKKNGSARHFVSFYHWYEGRGWRFWKLVRTAEAKALNVVHTKRDLIGECSQQHGCLHREHVFAEIDVSTLEERVEKPLRLQVLGDGAAIVLEIPATNVRAQLAASRYHAAQVVAGRQ